MISTPKNIEVANKYQRLYFKLNPLALSMLMLLSCPSIVKADNYFNPAFLQSDPMAVADLSQFEKGNAQAPGKYRVDVFVNDMRINSSDIIFTKLGEAKSKDDTGLRPVVTKGELRKLGVNVDAFDKFNKIKDEDIVEFTSIIPDSSTEFDFSQQVLHLNFPQAALVNHARGYIPPSQWDQGINAFLMNYAFTASNSQDRSAGGSSSNDYFLGLNGGFNYEAWRFRNYSTLNYTGDVREGSKSDWQHVSTYVERAIIPLKGELTLGDSYTSSDIFDSFSFRGAELSSDDNMLPDSLRGFAPSIHGIAKSNAQVTIKQSGFTIYQSYVPPGAFTINDLFPTSSSGDLAVEVKEADGSLQTYTVPYSAVPLLQRDGRVKYDFVVARYRPGTNEQDETSFGEGSLIWGLPHGITLYGGVQYSSKYEAVALGMGFNLGTLGAVSADVTTARSQLPDDSEYTGESVRFLYSKSLSDIGTDFQLMGYRYSTSNFYTFEDTTYKNMSGYTSSPDESSEDDAPNWLNYYNLSYIKRDKLQFNINQDLGNVGSIYLSGSEQTYWNTDEKDTLMQVGYNGLLLKDISFGISYNYSKNSGQDEADNIFALSLSVPLSHFLSKTNNPLEQYNTAYATYLLNTDKHGATTQEAGLSGTLLEDNNLSYSVNQGYGNHGTGNSGSASLAYKGTYGNANIGYNYSNNSDYQQVNYGLSGGVVAGTTGVTFGQPLGDTNILVAVPGAEDVSIQNSTGVKTDWRGYTIIPYATVYRENRVALDLNTISDDVDIDGAVVSVVPTKGALVKANFKAHVGKKALITLKKGQNYIPFGSKVSNDADAATGIVGDSGEVYMSGLSPEGKLKVQWGAGEEQQCVAHYKLASPADIGIARLTASCN